MTPDELREKVARAIADYELPVGPGWQDRWRDYFGTADAAIAVVLEEAARVAEREGIYPELNIAHGGPDWYRHGRRIAAAIRALASGRTAS